MRSHPSALEQCRALLAQLPNAAVVPASTTADAARETAESGDLTAAAIAGPEAAGLYGLVTLRDDVGDGPAFTRFVSVAPFTWLGAGRTDARTAFTFVTDHRPGALHVAIGPLAEAGLDLVRLVSRPLPASPWSYRFDAVVAGHPLDPVVRRCTRRAGEPHALASHRRGLRSCKGGLMSVSETTDDPFVKDLRREISDLDSALVELVNKRLRLVAKLKRYKEEHGIGFVDLAREEWMLQYLQRANRGPLSAEGLAELYHELLDLMKREVQKGG